MSVEPIVDYGNQVGENPLWHSGHDCLYWCEHDTVSTGKLFRYDPADSTHEMVYEGGYIGGFTIQADDSLLLFGEGGVVKTWRAGTITETRTLELEGETPAALFNDVIADPDGRVFCGTRYDDGRDGGLYRLDHDGTTSKVLEGIATSNGLGFSPDLSTLYYADTGDKVVRRYPYDRDSGSLGAGQPFVTFSGEDGLPDGLTVDQHGHVWIAHVFGGAVVRYSPASSVTNRIEVPVGMVTSLTFGGRTNSSLYITTGGGQNKERYGEHAGALFRANPEAEGTEEFRSTIRL